MLCYIRLLNVFITLNWIEIIFLTNTKIFHLIAIVKKFLKKTKTKIFIQIKISKNRHEFEIAFVNIENCENFEFRNDIKNVLNKISIFIVFLLKLHNVFKIFQKNWFCCDTNSFFNWINFDKLKQQCKNQWKFAKNCYFNNSK